MIGHWVQYSHALVGTYRSASVLQVIQAILPGAYSGERNYVNTLEVDDLYKLPFLCHLISISTCNMLNMQPKAHDPKHNSLFI